MMLNPDIIKSENQILEVGTVLNVTYYTSPLTITVTKERLAQEVIFPESTVYEEDESKPLGYTEIVQAQENGLQNVLYSEKWINGVRESGSLKSETVVKEPVQGVTAIGTNYQIKKQLDEKVCFAFDQDFSNKTGFIKQEKSKKGYDK